MAAINSALRSHCSLGALLPHTTMARTPPPPRSHSDHTRRPPLAGASLPDASTGTMLQQPSAGDSASATHWPDEAAQHGVGGARGFNEHLGGHDCQFA
mmetsp:Transcript_47315/g.118165  ORF Transcript_47315/g.118165 Transcript_47315/m.118165 type:complete len:98 (+) Transcript_47315:392-685(+)